jgi:hypothetical protein
MSGRTAAVAPASCNSVCTNFDRLVASTAPCARRAKWRARTSKTDPWWGVASTPIASAKILTAKGLRVSSRGSACRADVRAWRSVSSKEGVRRCDPLGARGA